jgi:hypothetical protein
MCPFHPSDFAFSCLATASYAASLKKRESVWAMSPDQPLVSLQSFIMHGRCRHRPWLLKPKAPNQPAVKAAALEKSSTPVAPRAAVSNGITGEHVRTSVQPLTNPPSAPRAHLSVPSNGVTPKPGSTANSTKLGIERYASYVTMADCFIHAT